MRTTRLVFTWAMAMALLGLGGATVAQDEAEFQPTVTQVTGEAIGDRTISQGVWTELDGGEQFHGNVFEHDIEWSDTRLPSLMRLHENLYIHYLDEVSDAWFWVGNIRLEDEHGAWTGPEFGLGGASDQGLVLQPRMMLLTGEGAYEGLSAMLQRQHEVITTASKPVFEGYIFEGALPPLPEPLAAN